MKSKIRPCLTHVNAAIPATTCPYHQKVVARVVWLLQAAQLMNVPMAAMAEDIEHAGGLTRKVRYCQDRWFYSSSRTQSLNRVSLIRINNSWISLISIKSTSYPEVCYGLSECGNCGRAFNDGRLDGHRYLVNGARR
jgi:hypothetical protein